MLLELARPPDRILDQGLVTRERDPRRELDRALERREVVAERIRTARRPEAHGRGDPSQEVVGRDEDAVLQETELTVGVTGCSDELPAVQRFARLDEDRTSSHCA